MNSITVQTPKKLSYLLLAQMVICALAVVSLLYMPIPMLSYLTQKYNVSYADAAGSISVFGFTYAVGFVVFGALSDRLGRKIVITYGLLALAVITVLLSLVNSWSLFIILRGLQGFAAASYPTTALAYLSENGTNAQRVWSIGWMTTALLGSGIFGQVYALEVVIPHGLLIAMLGFALVHILTVIRFMFIANTIASTGKSLIATYKPILHLLDNHALHRTYLSALLLLFSFVAFYLALDNYAAQDMQAYGISKLQMRLIAVPAFIFTLFASKLIGLLKSPHKAVIIGLFVGSSGLFLAGFSTNISHIWILVSSLIFVSGIAIAMTSLNVRTMSVVEPDIRGIAVSIHAFMLFIGSSIAPFFIRYLAEFSLQTVLFTLAGLLLGAVIYNLSYKES